MCIALLAAMEAIVRADPVSHSLSDYHQIEKVYTILNTGSHPGSFAIRKKVKDLRREEAILTTMLANGFNLSPQHGWLLPNDDFKWDEWLKARFCPP